MDLLGKPTINPVLFYSGKAAGYYTWTVLLLQLLGMQIFSPLVSGVNHYISFVLIFSALVFIILSFKDLGMSVRLGLPAEETVLKTYGIYRLSRNPMYVGFNLLTISSLVYFLNFWIVIPGLYSIGIYHMIILGEEQFLESRFGTEFNHYKDQVRRYL